MNNPDDPERDQQNWLMVVDDDDDIREVLGLILGLRKYVVVGAPDGLAALDLLDDMATLPFVILLDLRMPRLDGLGFLERLREDAARSTIPVIVMSGDAMKTEAAECSGVTVAVTKPVNLEHLLSLVSRFDPRGIEPSPKRRGA